MPRSNSEMNTATQSPTAAGLSIFSARFFILIDCFIIFSAAIFRCLRAGWTKFSISGAKGRADELGGVVGSAKGRADELGGVIGSAKGRASIVAEVGSGANKSSSILERNGNYFLI